MTRAELLDEVIEKAEKNGWRRTWWINLHVYKKLLNAHFTDLSVRIDGKSILMQGDFVQHIYHAFIFDPKFARAFFGRFWMFHIINVMCKKDQLKSLEKYLQKEKSHGTKNKEQVE